MDQFIPTVSFQDIERVVQRDYPENIHREIFELIRVSDIQEKNRTVLACLKLATGDIKKLKNEIKFSIGDWRDTLLPAEYPFYSKIMFRTEKFTEKEISEIILKDKNQYLSWLNQA